MDRITPTRRLSAKEKRVFERIVNEFAHLTAADVEQLCQLAEAQIRYESALKECKKQPVITVPVFNRSTGQATGNREVPNPANLVMKQAQAMVTTLSRRLLIDAASSEKRTKLLTKRARAEAAQEQAHATQDSARAEFTEKQIAEVTQWLRDNTALRGTTALRNVALDHLHNPVKDAFDAEWESGVWYIDDDGTRCPAPTAKAFLQAKFRQRTE